MEWINGVMFVRSRKILQRQSSTTSLFLAGPVFRAMDGKDCLEWGPDSRCFSAAFWWKNEHLSKAQFLIPIKSPIPFCWGNNLELLQQTSFAPLSKQSVRLWRRLWDFTATGNYPECVCSGQYVNWLLGSDGHGSSPVSANSWPGDPEQISWPSCASGLAVGSTTDR